MARQSNTPVTFSKSRRVDRCVLMSSARAGVVVPAAYIPLLPMDSCSGRVAIDISLKEMPKPLLNAVSANVQAWFVPKSAHPKFPGRDEVNHAFTGENIKSLGAADRAPPAYFDSISGAAYTTMFTSKLFKTLGLHYASGANANADLVDAFNLVYNFRLAAHSSRLTRRKYATEDIAAATTLPPAFWPSGRFARVVPDYERALVVGALDLDVVAGSLPVTGFSKIGTGTLGSTASYIALTATDAILSGGGKGVKIDMTDAGPQIFAQMAGRSFATTLNDIDKARTTQAFAQLRTAYAGNDATGFDNDDTLVALLMQGIAVQPDDFKRPWLLDSKRVPVGFGERFATDGNNLDKSVSLGRASAVLSLNVPANDMGGMIIVTIEVLPERIDERMSDEFLFALTPDDLPNALRDVQRTEPVDLVLNRRVDARHATPSALYGYEPMNDKWNRDFTHLGGDFYMGTPGGGWTENRSSIWQTEIVNPTFSGTHYLAPSPFPHDVFADQNADAFEFVARHEVAIVGLTQIGDVLAENNDDYDAVRESGL